MADQSVDKAVKLSDTSARIKSIDIETIDELITVNPPKYLRSSYHELNGCVWLSTCLLIISQDSELADHFLSKYKASCCKYEWLCIRAKETRGNPNLNAHLRDDKTCYLNVCSVSVPEGFNNE